MINRPSLLALTLLAACSATTPGAAEPGGSKWTFVSIDGQRPVSSRTSLTIGEGRIGANVGCNGMGGDLTIEDGRLIAGPIVSTQMFCDGLMDQERAVADLLGARPAFFIENDRMVIHSDQHKAELVRTKD
jgi:heat shock protein HslJ